MTTDAKHLKTTMESIPQPQDCPLCLTKQSVIHFSDGWGCLGCWSKIPTILLTTAWEAKYGRPDYEQERLR